MCSLTCSATMDSRQAQEAESAIGTSGRGLQYTTYEANAWAAVFSKSGMPHLDPWIVILMEAVPAVLATQDQSHAEKQEAYSGNLLVGDSAPDFITIPCMTRAKSLCRKPQCKHHNQGTGRLQKERRCAGHRGC